MIWEILLTTAYVIGGFSLLALTYTLFRYIWAYVSVELWVRKKRGEHFHNRRNGGE